MNWEEQRKLGLRLYGDISELREVITTKCWAEILKTAKNYKDQVIAKVDQWPSEWAYRWAWDIGDRKIMQDRVTESEWAYWWALHIGDQEIMRDRVTESDWAYRWALRIGDQEIMRDRVTDPEWIKEWDRYFNKRGEEQ